MQRIDHIDVARGLGILLVVAGHHPLVADQPGKLFALIFAFHLPLFFFLSGMLFKPTQPLGTLLARRANGLLKPYAVVLLSIVAAQVLLLHRDAGPLLARVLYGTGNTVASIPMWFLPHLWLLAAFGWVLLRLVGSASSLAARVALLTALLVMGSLSAHYFGSHPWYPIGPDRLVLGLPWSLDLLPLAGFYFLLGYYTREQSAHMSFKPWWLIASLLAFALLHIQWGGVVDFNLRRYDHPLVATALALLGIYASLQLACLLACARLSRKVFAYVGTGTLFILILHVFIQTQAFAWLEAQGTGWTALNVLLSFSTGVLVPLLLWETSKRSRLLGWLLLTPPFPRKTG